MDPTTISIPDTPDNPDTAAPAPALQVDDRVRRIPTGPEGWVRAVTTEGKALVAFDAFPPEDCVWVDREDLVVLSDPEPTAVPEPADLPMARRVAADLRALANVLDQHPTLPMKYIDFLRGNTARFSVKLATAAEVDQWATALGVEAKDDLDTQLPKRVLDAGTDDGLGIWVYAYLPKPDPAEVGKALAFYREHGPAAGEPS